MTDPRVPDPQFLEQYYRCFNERRIIDGATYFADDAQVEFTGGDRQRGREGYMRVAQQWLTAFPNAQFSIERIEQRSASMCEVHLRATGTHRGVLEVAGCRFKPSGADASLRLRELLDFQDGRIAASVLSIDLNDLIAQLSSVDYDELIKRVGRIAALGEDLARAATDHEMRRDVAQRLGVELDAARRASRPHYQARPEQ